MIENALDATARSIEVRFKDHGVDVVEVSDDGRGVRRGDVGMLTTKYATSKLERFEDLEALRTFGFRGEALSSLCGVSGEFEVTTRTEEDVAGMKIAYDGEGRVMSESTTARSVGTTVRVGRLFEPLPVRRKELIRNAKREYGKALAIVQAYALVSKSVRILCTHQSGKYGRTNVLHTRGEDASVRENIVTVFGSKMIASMRELELELDIGTGVRVSGFISEPRSGCGRAGTDRQFYYVNGRPVDVPRVARVVNETYRSFNPNQAPMVVLDFQLATNAYDVNVTPDKRKIMLHDEEAMLAQMRDKLVEAFSQTRYTYAVTQEAPASAEKASPLELSEQNGAEDDEDAEDETWTPAKGDDEEMFAAVLRTASGQAEGSRGSKRDSSARSIDAQRNLQTFGFTRDVTSVAIGGGWKIATTTQVSDEAMETEAPAKAETTPVSPSMDEIEEDNEDAKRPRLEDTQKNEDERPSFAHVDVEVEDVGATVEELRRPDATEEILDDGSIPFSMEDMLARRRNSHKRATAKQSAVEAFDSAHVSAADDDTAESTERATAAARELERVFDKADFAKMRIVGQFNLGFILATLGDDLFIIDQHASDEIYNFERLQRTTTLSKQPLIHPVPLDLTASEEQTVLQNMPVFLKNGFGFCDVAESVPGADMNNSSVDPSARCGSLRLSAVPVLKNVVFDKTDVHELVSMLDRGQHSLPANSQLSIGLTRHDQRGDSSSDVRVLRPAKTRAALAMKACRGSIMIGDALDVRSMRRVLNNLTTLDAPWNCPHGRPTMRHLFALRRAF